jgi:hypothetical protein
MNGAFVEGQLAGLVVAALFALLFVFRRRAWVPVVGVAIFAFAAFAGWNSQFHLTQRVAASSYYDIEPIVSVAIGIVIVCLMRFRPAWTTLIVVYVFSELLQAFSFLYWSYGGGHNFNLRLSHLDSLYFSLGTLSPAGKGNIGACQPWRDESFTALMSRRPPLSAG